MRLNKYDIRYHNAVTRWDEGLPLGNGKIGCLIYGDGPIRLAVDRVDLWDTRLNPATQEKGFNYANLVRLVKSGKEEDWAEYRRLFDKIYSGTPYPTKLTAGRLELDFGVKTQNIRSQIDIQKAIACVEIPETGARIEAFTSAVKFIGVAKITGEYSLNLHIPNYISGDENGECLNGSGIGDKNNDSCLRYPRAEIVREGEFLYYNQKTATEFCYGVVVLQKGNELYFTIATSQEGDFIENAKKELKNASELGYETLKKEHIAWWQKYWKKSSVSVGDELLEKTYYRSYYLFASCSRKGFYPMPLQGVWTADNDSPPPWKGDYHHDTNTQLSYQSFLKANRLDEGRVFVDYLWSLREEFRRFAKQFYGVKGLLIPGVSTINGKPMGGWAQYSLSPTMSIWSAQSFDEFWLYTGDKSFLKNRAYPFLKEVGEAIYGLLEEKDGKLYLPLSSSPEIHDAEPSAYLQPNSNFDLSLMIYLYRTLCGYCDILGKDKRKYENILSKLDEIAVIGEEISLNKNEKLQETHRHFSHLMCLYPLHLINYDTKEHKRLYEVALFSLEKLGMGYWVGFSYAMCAQIYAMAYMGNSAYEKLRQFANGFVAENGFHLNGDFKRFGYSTFHYRPFTLESSFGFCDALQEMLLQEHQGYLHLFPAIPEEWENVSFEKFLCCKGIKVSAILKKKEITKLILETNNPRTVTVKSKYLPKAMTIELKKGKNIIKL